MERRHDLDWLRILLFGLLIVHHAAVGFAPFGAEIYGFANDQLGGELLSLAIYFSHTWRLPALFLISGLGTYFATSRGAGIRFMSRRVVRLMIPALFGTFVLNLFAGYAIARATGDGATFAGIARSWWLSPEPPQVMHLWFLFNLTIYTLLCWPLFAARRWIEELDVKPVQLVGVLATLATAIVIAGKPYAAAIAGDAYQFPWYWSLFAAGYLIGTQHQPILAWVARWWPVLLGLGLVSFTVEIGLLASYLTRHPELGAALAEGGWAASGLAPAYSILTVLFTVAEGLNAWLFSLTALGLCARYLNRPSSLLANLSRATFPVYVLHFPITIIGLALLAQPAWPWQLELLLLVAAVFLCTACIYVVADRSPFPISLLGGRPSSAPPRVSAHPL